LPKPAKKPIIPVKTKTFYFMLNLKKIIHYLIYALIFLIPWQTRWIYQPGFLNNQKWEYANLSLYFTQILLGLIILFSLGYLTFFLTKNKKALKKNRIAAGTALVLVLYLVLTCFLSTEPGLAWQKFNWLIMAVALILVILFFKPKTNKIFWSLILAASLQSVLAIQQFIEQKVLANKWLGMAGQLPEKLGTPVVETNGIRWLRSFGSFPHPNMLAGFLAIGLLLTIALYSLVKSQKQQKILRLLFVINFIGLLTTLSRAGIYGFLLFIILLGFLAGKKKTFSKNISKFALITLFIFVIFSVSFPQLIFTRALSQGRIEQQSNSTRIEQFKESAEIIKKSFPLGAGPANYVVELQKLYPQKPAWQIQPVHNTYILLLAELGLFGLAVIIILLFFSLCQLKNIRQKNPKQIIALTAWLLLLVLAGFDHYFWSFWSGILLTAFLFALWRLDPTPLTNNHTK